MHYNLQYVHESNQEMKNILDKTILPINDVTDSEMVTLEKWILTSQSSIYGVTDTLPESTQGLFIINMDEANFWSGWDNHKWNLNSTVITTEVYGDTTLKNFVTSLLDNFYGYFQTIYKIEGPDGKIVFVHTQQKDPGFRTRQQLFGLI